MRTEPGGTAAMLVTAHTTVGADSGSGDNALL